MSGYFTVENCVGTLVAIESSDHFCATLSASSAPVLTSCTLNPTILDATAIVLEVGYSGMDVGPECERPLNLWRRGHVMTSVVFDCQYQLEMGVAEESLVDGPRPKRSA